MKADYSDRPIKWPDGLPKVHNCKIGEVRLGVPCPHAIDGRFFGYEDHYQTIHPYPNDSAKQEILAYSEVRETLLPKNKVQEAFAKAGCWPVFDSSGSGWIWKVWFKCDKRLFGSSITFMLVHERYVELLPCSVGLGLVSDPFIGLYEWLAKLDNEERIASRFRVYGKPHDWGADYRCRRCGGSLSEILRLNSDCNGSKS